MLFTRFTRVATARRQRATWRDEVALRTHSPAQQVRSAGDKSAHDGRPLPVGRGLFDRIWMRLIRTAQTSPRRPATQRGSTHQTGCSHMVCVRPAPRNPKQGPSFCLVVPDMHLSILACALWASLSLAGVRLKCTVGFNPYDSLPPWSRRLPCPAGPHGPGLRRSLHHPADRPVLTHTHGCSHRLPGWPARRNPKQTFRFVREHLKYLGVIERAIRALFSLSWSSSGVLRRIRPM